MLRSINEESSFENNIKLAINAIKTNRCDLAYNYLIADMIENDHSAQVFNLLGIISEYRGDEAMACKYYRAAYVFDPTYKPADKNLEKLTSFFYRFNGENIDYGDNMEKKYIKMHIVDLKNNEENRKSAC